MLLHELAFVTTLVHWLFLSLVLLPIFCKCLKYDSRCGSKEISLFLHTTRRESCYWFVMLCFSHNLPSLLHFSCFFCFILFTCIHFLWLQFSLVGQKDVTVCTYGKQRSCTACISSTTASSRPQHVAPRSIWARHSSSPCFFSF